MLQVNEYFNGLITLISPLNVTLFLLRNNSPVAVPRRTLQAARDAMDAAMLNRKCERDSWRASACP